MKTLLVALLLLVPTLCGAQGFEVPPGPAIDRGSYPAIEFMSAGESSALPSAADVEDFAPATPQAQLLRVVVYRSEIDQSLVIETVTTGLEGCCAKVAKARSVDLAAFARHFGFEGEVSGFMFAGWSSPRSFRFTYKGKPFHATVTRSGRLRVDRGRGSDHASNRS